MRLKFEKKQINCRVTQIEAVELLKTGHLTEKVKFPSGHIFSYRVELSILNVNLVHYSNSILTFEITKKTVESLLQAPTKNGIQMLQDAAVYVFSVDIRKERRKKIRKI